MTDQTEWEGHCQDHVDSMELPVRCSPEMFRHALACCGYCACCLGNETLPVAERMRQFPTNAKWKDHIAQCISAYLRSLPHTNSVPCPHATCKVVLDPESAAWHHLGDVHGTHKPEVEARRRAPSEEMKTNFTRQPRSLASGEN